MIKLVRCTNVLMEGLTVQNSPGWTINPIFCERVVFRGLTINNPMDSTSTDAFDLESCRDVHISDCTLGAGDDWSQSSRARSRPGCGSTSPARTLR